tara:strand:- start:594 stop:878 length:285 start_codon:yes stop_codon:yes gene_type:complete
VKFTILNEIRFHGKPPNIFPLKYSIIDKRSEKIKIELKFILRFKNFSKKENSPYKNDNKKGMNIIENTTKFSKFSSNFNEFEIQYKFEQKYPNP